MNIVFFVIIIISLSSGFVCKKKNVSIILLLLVITFLIIKYPQISVTSAKNGINLWIFVVLPSLLPFFIINDMLVSLRVPENISRLFSPFAKIIFKTSGYGAYVFIMSIFSGYPTGAKITSELIYTNKISPREGQKILTFSSTSGPLFIIGVVGSTMLKSTSAGYLLILSHILGAIINGIIFGNIIRNPSKSTFGLENSYNNNKSIGEILTKAIQNSLITGGLIGGYIILFSVIIDLLNKIEFFSIFSNFINHIFFIPNYLANIISYIFQASLEISNGCNILSTAPMNMEFKLIFLSFIISFSGLSIIGQVASIINNSGIDLKLYIFSKVSHGIISSLLCYTFLKFNLFSINTTTNQINTYRLGEIPILIMLLSTLLLLNLLGCKFKKLHKMKFPR